MKRRLFLGIPLSDLARKHVKNELQNLPGKIVPSPNWHITLHFLGDVEEDQQSLLTEQLRKIHLGDSFEVTLSHLGAFPTLRYSKIMWLGLSAGVENTTQVANLLAEELKYLKFKVDIRPFVPHITLSRFPQPKNLSKWLSHHEFKEVSMKVEEVILYESILGAGGSTYTPLEHFRLS